MGRKPQPLQKKTEKFFTTHGKDDYQYKKKKLGKYIIELYGGTKRGADILVWRLATKEDKESAKKLPHIFTLSDNEKYFLVMRLDYWSYWDALENFEYAKGVDLYDLYNYNTLV